MNILVTFPNGNMTHFGFKDELLSRETINSQKVFNLSTEEDVAAILLQSKSENEEERLQDSDEEDGVISVFQDKIGDKQLQNPYSSIDQIAAESFDLDFDSLLQKEPDEGNTLKIVQVPTKLQGKNYFR
ncbi:hypothetical protein QE152_g1326 [Popillia japonica]|uniref:Uncharacterized protein n=1 Tax=Popillia japonica TaxID=7064 RepID=A0AAW1N528_POPJA